MNCDRVPVGEGAGEGLGGRVLGCRPVEGAGEQRPEDRAAVVLVEQPERLRRVYGHVLASPSDSVPLEGTGGAGSCWARSGEVMGNLGSGLVRRGVESMGPNSRVLLGSWLMGPCWRNDLCICGRNTIGVGIAGVG